MELRTFGDPAAAVSVMGLGCGRLGSFNNATPLAESRRALRRALDLGVTLFETADIYGQGASEREIGALLKGRRDSAFIVTKVGNRFSALMRALTPFKPILRRVSARSKGARDAIVGRRDGHLSQDFSRAYLARALEGSLRRLGVEDVDALLLHSPPVEVVAARETTDFLLEAVRVGKVRRFGYACDTLAVLRAAGGAEGVSLVSVPLDVFDAASAEGLIAKLTARRVGVLVREVLRGQPGLPPVGALAAAVARTGVTCALVGASTPAHLDELGAAV